jgi:hypothetical protein
MADHLNRLCVGINKDEVEIENKQGEIGHSMPKSDVVRH